MEVTSKGVQIETYSLDNSVLTFFNEFKLPEMKVEMHVHMYAKVSSANAIYMIPSKSNA